MGGYASNIGPRNRGGNDTGSWGGVTQSAQLTLTASQLNHLNSAPVVLALAPGAGRVILPSEATLFLYRGSHGYYTSANADHPEIAVGATYLKSDSISSLDIARFSNSISRVKFTDIIGTSSQTLDFATLANQPLYIGSHFFDLIDYGEVTASTLVSGGTGYQIGDTGGFNENNTSGTYTVTGVGGGGAVTTYTLGSTPDTVVNGATAGQTLTTFVNTGGGDGAFSIHVTTIAPGNGTVTVDVHYQIFSV